MSELKDKIKSLRYRVEPSYTETEGEILEHISALERVAEASKDYCDGRTWAKREILIEALQVAGYRGGE